MAARASESSAQKSKRRSPKAKGHARVEGGTVVRDGARKGAKKAKKAKRARRKPRPPEFTARTADKHELYQHAVQSPEEDVKFLARVYKSARGRPARHFREDFCGTALLSATWVRRGKDYTSEGFDIDPDPVSWGLERNFEPLGEAAKRCTLHLKDVREPSSRPPDVRSAQNFSWYAFHERAELLEYFRAAHDDLARNGAFVLDVYGGPEAMEEMEEVRDVDEGFTYVWDQDRYDPATGRYRCFIHFQFEDGTEKRRAFRYDWRLWGLPEAKDLLLEAGFKDVVVYWEGTDEDGESGNGIYRRTTHGDNDLAWVTYLVALK